MSWIKDNKFMVALVGGTLVGMILLFFAGSRGMGQYDQAKTDFDSAAQEASTFERLPLYPKPENKDGKSKALEEYRKATESLQAAFQNYRPKGIKNVSPEEFTNHLKTANDEVRKAFEESRTKVPEPFFCGFENYKTSLAGGNATGILDYQLAGIKSLMLTLAKCRATELKNVYRPALPEEVGKPYKAKDSDVARPLPLEITFQAPEKSLRAFLSEVVKPDGRYFVVRSMRVLNTKKDPPRAADAKFDKPAAKNTGASDVFGGGFVLPGDEPKADVKKPEKPTAPAPADSSRILSQVLGNEEVQVFLRLDMMQFLPAKKLP